MAPWLGGAIESALAITGHDIEVVVAENASTDDSLAVASSFSSDRRFRLAGFDRHVPPIENLNRAVRASTGEWAVLLSADDVVSPVLADVVAEAAARGATLIGSNVILVNAAGEPSRPHPGYGPHTYKGRAGLAKVATRRPFFLCGTAFRRSDFDKVGGMDPRWLTADHDFFIRVAGLPGAVPMQDPRIGGTYFVDRGSTWTRLVKSGDDIRILGKMYQDRGMYRSLGIDRAVNRTLRGEAIHGVRKDLSRGDRATACKRLRFTVSYARGLPRAAALLDLLSVRLFGRVATPQLRSLLTTIFRAG
jgi:glycosyltransferase involved in cell wall biosynthesis